MSALPVPFVMILSLVCWRHFLASCCPGIECLESAVKCLEWVMQYVSGPPPHNGHIMAEWQLSHTKDTNMNSCHIMTWPHSYNHCIIRSMTVSFISSTSQLCDWCLSSLMVSLWCVDIITSYSLVTRPVSGVYWQCCDQCLRCAPRSSLMHPPGHTNNTLVYQNIKWTPW